MDSLNSTGDAPSVPAWGPRLAIAAAAVDVVSLIFPIVAARSRDPESLPRWWGPLDVGIAALLAVSALVVSAFARGRVSTRVEKNNHRLYWMLILGILFLTAVFLLFVDPSGWLNGLPGVAWRVWLFYYLLHEWLALRAK